MFGLTRPGIEPKSTASVADALSTRPLIGIFIFFWLAETLAAQDFQTSVVARALAAQLS